MQKNAILGRDKVTKEKDYGSPNYPNHRVSFWKGRAKTRCEDRSKKKGGDSLGLAKQVQKAFYDMPFETREEATLTAIKLAQECKNRERSR